MSRHGSGKGVVRSAVPEILNHLVEIAIPSSALASARNDQRFAIVPKQAISGATVTFNVGSAGEYTIDQDGSTIATQDAVDGVVTVSGVSIPGPTVFTLTRTEGDWNWNVQTADQSTSSILTLPLNVPGAVPYWGVVGIAGEWVGDEIMNPTWVGNTTGANVASGERSAYSFPLTLASDVRLIAVQVAVEDAAFGASLTEAVAKIDSVIAGPSVPGYGLYVIVPLDPEEQELAAGSYDFQVDTVGDHKNRFWSGQSAGWTASPFTAGAWAEAPSHGVYARFWYIPS